MPGDTAIEELGLDDDQLQDWFHERRYTDGLPVVLPTVERVDRFLAESGFDRTSVVGSIEPVRGVATVENVAVNAVMAGCRPRQLGVVLAAIEALLQPRFNLRGVQTTTNPVAPLVLVNGPVRHELDIGWGGHALSGSSQANGPIGRAVRLVLRNIGGAGAEVSQTSLGLPARYTFCLAEWEEQSPWEPLHASLGYAATDSVVTTIGVESIVDVVGHMWSSAEPMIAQFTDTMRAVGSNVLMGQGTMLLLLSPAHARLLARDGWTRRRLQERFFEDTKFRAEDWPFAAAAGLGRVGAIETLHGWVADEQRIAITGSPDDILIAVAGRDDPIHSTYLPPMTYSDATSARVRTAPAGRP